MEQCIVIHNFPDWAYEEPCYEQFCIKCQGLFDEYLKHRGRGDIFVQTYSGVEATEELMVVFRKAEWGMLDEDDVILMLEIAAVLADLAEEYNLDLADFDPVLQVH